MFRTDTINTDLSIEAPTSLAPITSSVSDIPATAGSPTTGSPTTGKLFVGGRPAWWLDAACRDLEAGLTEVFFSEELQDIAQAKRICAGCEAIAPCLEGSIERREPWGVWGGQLFRNGRILATKRRRGRPPKNPRPEDQLPEVPVPEHLVSISRRLTA